MAIFHPILISVMFTIPLLGHNPTNSLSQVYLNIKPNISKF